MDGSDFPCFILWPTRTAEQSFWCIDAWQGDWVRLDKCSFMAPVGIEHFIEAACQALGIPSCHVSGDTHLERLHENKFSLTQGAYQLKGRHLRKRVESIRTWVFERSGSDAESGWSGVSDDEQTELQQALLQCLRLDDGHVLATLIAIVLALCEGRTGLSVSRMLWASKTRLAACRRSQPTPNGSH